MQVNIDNISDTKVKLIITADSNVLESTKKAVISKLAPTVKIDGFRRGNVPPTLAEKHIDANTLQNDFLEEAINRIYVSAVNKYQLRVVSNPQISIKKFVPFTQLEISAEVEVVGKVFLPNYKLLKVQKIPVKVTTKDVNDVLERLQAQSAQHKSVTRPAKKGDRVRIDFSGTNEKGDAVKGAMGKDYPLILGSNSFIPGFEDSIIGLRQNQKKTFVITFPKDYSLKALQSKKINFEVKVNAVEEVIKAPIDDQLATKIGPFKNLNDLKKDIEKQLKIEKEHQAERDFEEAIIKEITDKAKVSLPQKLLDEQLEALDKEFQQNLAYRGESITDYLEANNITKEQYKSTQLQPAAEQRLKAGLVLSEIAAKEKIEVTPEEVEIRKQILKGQYKDPKMQDQMNKQEATREIASRLLTEKTIAKLKSYIAK